MSLIHLLYSAHLFYKAGNLPDSSCELLRRILGKHSVPRKLWSLVISLGCIFPGRSLSHTYRYILTRLYRVSGFSTYSCDGGEMFSSSSLVIRYHLRFLYNSLLWLLEDWIEGLRPCKNKEYAS